MDVMTAVITAEGEFPMKKTSTKGKTSQGAEPKPKTKATIAQQAPRVALIKAKATKQATPAKEAATLPNAEFAPEDPTQPLPVEAESTSTEPIVAELTQAADANSPTQATAPPAKAKSRQTAPARTEGVRAGSKTATVLDLMKRTKGVTLKELMTATGWQAHSVRGFISGTLGKKMGLTVISAKGEEGERSYSLKA